MPSVVRAITRIQDADDFSGSLTDTYIPVWSNSQQKFVMTAQSVTAPGGSSGYIQYNNAGAFGASGVYWDSANSRVGIGTTSPSQKLDVNGSVNVATALIVPVVRPASDSTTAFKIKTAADADFVTFDTTNGRVLIISDVARLEFRSTAGAQLAYLQSTTSGDLDFNNIGNGSFRVKPAGGGGLAVYNGSSNLLFAGATVSNNTAVERLVLLNKSGAASAGIGNRIKFQANNSFANTRDIAYLDVIFSNATQGSEVGDFVFYTSISNTLTEAMRVQGLRLGIGQPSPTAFLHLPASTISYASLRIPSGTAPTSPNNGDIWFDGTDYKCRIGGVTKTFTVT